MSVKITGLKELRAIATKIKEQAIDPLPTDRDIKRQLGEIGTNAIKTRTRKGFGVKEGGIQTQLKRLRPSTKKRRADLKASGKLSSETSPGKSNLTESGKMINSIVYQNTSNGVELGFSGSKNIKKAEFAAKERRFFDFTKEDVARLGNVVVTALVRRIKQIKF